MAKITDKKTTKKAVAVKTKAPVKKTATKKVVKVAPQKIAAKKVEKKLTAKSTVKIMNKKVDTDKIVRNILIALSVIVAVAIIVVKTTKKSNMMVKKENTFSFVSKDGKEKVDLKLQIADTDQARLKGLQGVKKLDSKTGMLFDFEEPGYYTMWMKGMDIPLDMVFLNNYGKVLTIAENRPPMNDDLITPCSVAYDTLSTKAKKNIDEDKFFQNCEDKYLKYQNLTRYVVEVPAGTIKAHNIVVGDVLLKK